MHCAHDLPIQVHVLFLILIVLSPPVHPSHHPHDHDLADSFPYFAPKLMCAHDPPIQVQASLRTRCRPWSEQVKSSKYDRDMVNVEYGLDMADEKNIVENLDSRYGE